MANVRTNQILSTSPLPTSSGGFPGLRYSRKRVLCYPTVISEHRKHLSAILAWLKLQQSLEIDFHYLHLLPTLNSMECKVLKHYHFICGRVSVSVLWAACTYTCVSRPVGNLGRRSSGAIHIVSWGSLLLACTSSVSWSASELKGSCLSPQCWVLSPYQIKTKQTKKPN